MGLPDRMIPNNRLIIRFTPCRCLVHSPTSYMTWERLVERLLPCFCRRLPTIRQPSACHTAPWRDFRAGGSSARRDSRCHRGDPRRCWWHCRCLYNHKYIWRWARLPHPPCLPRIARPMNGRSASTTRTSLNSRYTFPLYESWRTNRPITTAPLSADSRPNTEFLVRVNTTQHVAILRH